MSEQQASITLSPEELRYRYIQDDFASAQECADLIKLIEDHGQIGDGYGGNPHPHTPTELFGGYSLDDKYVPGQLAPGHQEALGIIMRARNMLRKHFGVPFLWLDYSQLVFRDPIEGTEATADHEVSHPWHFDNQSPGVRFRTHTAILYLNDGFVGGNTRFKETDFGPYREVAPQAGKLIAFDVAMNAHSVSKLVSGKRYVLNMWFSTSWRKFPKHRRIFKPL